MFSSTSARWTAVTIFVFSAVLNYLDRQVLATMVDIWRSHPEKGAAPFSYADYGSLLLVFALAYALSAPFMGWFIDRVGLNRGICLSVAVWAVASFGTGLSRGFTQLLICRALLGIAEASGVSAVGKATAMYLKPEERAVGAGMGQLGLSLGAGLAPSFAVFFAYNPAFGWRWSFFAAGMLSLIWIPAWLITSRLVRPLTQPKSEHGLGSWVLARDPRLWAMVLANGTGMTIYYLWINWSPTYLVRVHHLTPAAASHYTPYIPIAGYFGAMLGGSLSWRFIRGGLQPVEARKRVCLIASCILLGTMAIPLLPTPLLATIGMSLSYFWIAAWSANMYTIPVDLYGADRAAFGVSALIFAYGLMQAIVSPQMGWVIEKYGFQPICFTFALMPLLAWLLLKTAVKTDSHPPTDHKSQALAHR